MSQDEDGIWHGAYSWEGQEYTLDNEDPEALLDDMEALNEVLSQDDTYALEYNDDLDRYIIEVQGSEEQFSDQVLAKAFAAAKADVMKRAKAEEDARRAREAAAQKAEKAEAKPEKAEPKPRGRRPSNGGPEPTTEARPMPDLPAPVAAAVVGFLTALSDLFTLLGNPPKQVQDSGGFKPAEPTAKFEEPATTPQPPRKRGLGTRSKG